MSSHENQRKTFEFFVRHLESKETFERKELESVTNWRGKTFNTYWSKQLKPFVVRTGNNGYRVSEAFRPFATWDKFQEHVTQVRRLSSRDYTQQSFDYVRIYEFFMPLTNEAHLRTALDALFYRDKVEARLKTIDVKDLQTYFPKKVTENMGDYHSRICNWVSEHFGGYSVYHVNGRFRAEPLACREKASTMPRYLVDETTAVARFIFPCKDVEEADLTEFLFTGLFVKAVVEVVNGEEEIWMTETGMKNRLHIWRVDKAERKN